VQRGIWRKIQAEIAIWSVGALPGLAIIGLVVVVRLAGTLQSIEWMALDKLLRLRPSEVIDERIVIVGINEADIRSLGTYPIPDRELAILLRKLPTYRPRVIGLDIIRDLPVELGHAELATVFRNSKNLIAIEKVLPERIAPQVGFSDAIRDSDGHLRRNLLGTPTPQGYKFSLSLRLAAAYLSAAGITLENGSSDRHAMRFGTTELPRFLPSWGAYVGADAGGVQILLNFRQASFRTLSLNNIKTGKFNPQWLRDRIILIGITSPRVDVVNSAAIPLTNLGPGQIYSVEFQAHAVSQIISAVLDQRPLLQVCSDGWEYVWIISWGLLGIALGRLSSSPLKNLLSVSISSIALAGVSYTLLLWGWWVPVIPAMFALALNGIGLATFYQYDRALRSRVHERQFIIDSTFDIIHNGPLQTLATILRSVRDQDYSQQQLLSQLESLNHELRTVYESLKQELPTQSGSLVLASSLQLDLHLPMHEVLYQVYSYTLERDFPCFKTIKVKIPQFDVFEHQHLSIEQKRGLCRFLEEALCNVGKHAAGVTRLSVTYTQQQGWWILCVADNGLGTSSSSQGRGTQQAINLARQLRGRFSRSPLFPQGTLCELTWPVAHRSK